MTRNQSISWRRTLLEEVVPTLDIEEILLMMNRYEEVKTL